MVRLNSRATIEQRAAANAATGQPSQTWETLAECWANVWFDTGAETVRADRETSTVKASIRIRRLAGVTAAMRVVCDSRVYRIVAVVPDVSRGRYTDLVCELTDNG